MSLDQTVWQSVISNTIFFFYFLAAVFLACYVPGKIMLGKNVEKIDGFFSKTVICIVLGLVLWGVQGVVFGYVNLRFLSYGYIVIFFLFWLKQRPIKKIITITSPLIYLKRLKKYHIILLSITLVGVFGQAQQFFVAGFVFNDGIRIFSGTADDAFFHSALINQIVRRFPPFEPGLVDVVVYNYHYWSNIIIAELVRVFHLPLLPTQFQYMYVLLSLLLGSTAYAISRILKFSSVATILFVYLQYFSSDSIYMLTLVTRRVFDFSVHPLEDGTMFLENPPRAFSFVIALAGVALLILWLRSKEKRLGFLVALLFGSLIGFKVHTGFLVLSALAGLGVYFLFKKEWSMLFVPLSALIISILVYFPVNRSSSGLLYSPFEMSRMFIVQPNLHISFFELARRVYEMHNNAFGALRMDVGMLGIFFLGQFGLRNIGWIPLRSTIKKLSMPAAVFLYSGIIATTVIGTLFLQPVAHGDTFNFYLGVSLFLSILAAITLGKFFTTLPFVLKVVLLVIIISLTLPRWIYKTVPAFKSYFSVSNPTIHKKELEAMAFVSLHTKENEVVLVANKGQWDSLYPYVSIFTKRDMFLSGQGILGRHGISYIDREEVIQKILSSEDSKEVKQLLKENKIAILYFFGRHTLSNGLQEIPLDMLYQNDYATIYRFKEI